MAVLLQRRPREGVVPSDISPAPTAGLFDPSHMADLQGGISAGLQFEMGIDSFFGASHAIRPNGATHTHSFRVQAVFVSDHVDEQGMLFGFREMSNMLEHEAKKYTNRFLNEIEPFTVVQPTGENLAAVIYRNLLVATTEVIAARLRLLHVTLWENPTSYIRVGAGGAR